MCEVFALFDSGEGSITAGQLGTILRSLSANPNEAEIQDLLKKADVDGSDARRGHRWVGARDTMFGAS